MFKKALLPMLFVLAGCASQDAAKEDWSKDCDCHHSTSSREHAACKARMADKMDDKKMGSCHGAMKMDKKGGASACGCDAKK